MKQKIIPNLWFDRNAEEAARLYVSLFADSQLGHVERYGKSGAEVSGMQEGSAMTVQFTLCGVDFAGINGGPLFKFTPATSFFVRCDTAAEVDRLYTALSDGGSVLMPLASYPFSERYAWVNDRFGLSWQLFKGNGAPRITPCLMFVKEQYGRAMEAIRFYGTVFGPSPIDDLMYYEPGEGERDGAVKHAEFAVADMRFMAMDSGFDHRFTFTPAVSFMVGCPDQAEIDRLWALLSAVPAAEACGWLQDTFGVSWQIVPDELGQIMNVNDPAKSEHLMKTMFKMKKLDIETLRNAAR